VALFPDSLAEHLLAGRGLDPEELARLFSERRIFGIGKSVRQFVTNYRDLGPRCER
jgi:hypothetical protein